MLPDLDRRRAFNQRLSRWRGRWQAWRTAWPGLGRVVSELELDPDGLVQRNDQGGVRRVPPLGDEEEAVLPDDQQAHASVAVVERLALTWPQRRLLHAGRAQVQPLLAVEADH